MMTTAEQIAIHPLDAPVRGMLVVPGDKSITHRALFFGALNNGITTIHHPSPAADCRSTFELLRAIGHGIRAVDQRWEIYGVDTLGPLGALALDCGNSGTTVRLAAGFLTGERGTFTLTGDASLSRRPMARVASPLETLGASIETTGGHLPMTIHAGGRIRGSMEEGINAMSAQVHSALFLAALRSERGAVIRRGKPMRDHTIRMAHRFGVAVELAEEYGARVDIVRPARIDCDPEITIPGDLSSAAFMIAAALIVPGSRLRIENVGLNPTRTAFLHSLAAMNATIRWEMVDDGFEPIGWIEAEYSPEMQGIEVGGESGPHISVAEMIDELPLLALVASQAHGVTIVRDASELRVKESDRIVSTRQVLTALGIEMEEMEDGFAIDGPQRIEGGGEVDHRGDHRLCMLAAIGALAARSPVSIIDPEAVAVSYPQFWSDLEWISGCRLVRSR